MTLRSFFTAAICVAGLTACGSGDGGTIGMGPSGERTFEDYCSVEGLTPSLRHTYILIDENMLSPVASAEEFIAKNAPIRNAVQAFASPALAVDSGTSEPRERISLFVLPADGTSANRIFSGCIPALSSDEIAEMRSQQSDINRFATGDATRGFEEAQGTFEGLVVASIRGAAEDVAEPASPSTGVIDQASAFRSLGASGRLINTDDGLPRVVLITQLGQTSLPEGATDEETIRQAAFDAATNSRFDLGLSDVFVIQPGGANEHQRAFADSFFLAQNGRLSYWGDQRPPTVDAGPVSVSRYIGEAQYPSGPETVQVRLATDVNGRLVQSWMVLRGQPDRATPMTGQTVCTSKTSCNIRNDDGDFAQAWSLSPGADPEFVNDMPFAGVRDFDLETNDEKLSGKLYDPAIDQFGPDPKNDSIAINATAQANAVF